MPLGTLRKMTLAPEEMTPVFSLANVWLTFHDSPVLKGVRLDIHKGEVFAVIGPSGEGKSSLLKMMAGLRNPTEGTIQFCGCDLRTLKGKNRSLILDVFIALKTIKTLLLRAGL